MQILPVFSIIALIGGLIIIFLRKAGKERASHQLLKRTITSLRLSKMLSYVGANLDDYIRFVPREDIMIHIDRCKQCRTLDICDRCLRDGMLIHDMSFCSNYRSLTEHSKTLAARKMSRWWFR